MAVLLKYQFWKNVTSEKWNSDGLNTFGHFLSSLKTKSVQKCSTRQSLIFPKWHSFKIGTLAKLVSGFNNPVRNSCRNTFQNLFLRGAKSSVRNNGLNVAMYTIQWAGQTKARCGVSRQFPTNYFCRSIYSIKLIYRTFHYNAYFPDFSLALILWLSSCCVVQKGDLNWRCHHFSTYKHHNFYSNDDFFTDNKFPFSTQKNAICWLFWQLEWENKSQRKNPLKIWAYINNFIFRWLLWV